jgi:hypothetical protein
MIGHLAMWKTPITGERWPRPYYVRQQKWMRLCPMLAGASVPALSNLAAFSLYGTGHAVFRYRERAFFQFNAGSSRFPVLFR